MALSLWGGHHHRVHIQKFTSTTAFVAIDLAGAEASSGPVRWARKVLQGGAKDLARSQTYTYGVLAMKRGGAAAGISAEESDRDEAVGAFVAEAAGMVADGIYLPDAAKGVGETDLVPLRDADPRDTTRCSGVAPTFAERCDALSIAVCAESTLGGIDGRTVAIETTGPAASVLAELLIGRGARVVVGPGVTATTHGMSALDSGAEVVFVGSNMGVIDHNLAEKLTGADAAVPCGRLPLTTKGLAVLRHAGVAAPADFVALAGSTIALWADPDRNETEIEADITEQIAAMSAEFSAHGDGPLLAACHRAEEFLGTWQDTLPFGRPLAP